MGYYEEQEQIRANNLKIALNTFKNNVSNYPTASAAKIIADDCIYGKSGYEGASKEAQLMRYAFISLCALIDIENGRGKEPENEIS